jgi:hypothetical protein
MVKLAMSAGNPRKPAEWGGLSFIVFASYQ